MHYFQSNSLFLEEEEAPCILLCLKIFFVCYSFVPVEAGFFLLIERSVHGRLQGTQVTLVQQICEESCQV